MQYFNSIDVWNLKYASVQIGRSNTAAVKREKKRWWSIASNQYLLTFIMANAKLDFADSSSKHFVERRVQSDPFGFF